MSGCSASSSPSLVPFAVQTGAKAPGFSPTAPEFTAETDSPLEGAGFEPSVPRERVCAFRDHVHSLQSVRHPLRSKWYVDYSDGTRPFGLDIHG